MLLTVTMGTKKQFKMYLEEDLFERLKQAAEKIGKSSGQEVAEEIICTYFPVWLNVNDSMNRAVQYQINKVSEEIVSQRKKGSTVDDVKKPSDEPVKLIQPKNSKSKKGEKVA
jgi:hypothetical protein